MKAILCTRAGGPDDLVLREIPDPAAGPGEAIVAVKAAALNFFDTLIIAGQVPNEARLPLLARRPNSPASSRVWARA